MRFAVSFSRVVTGNIRKPPFGYVNGLLAYNYSKVNLSS